MYLYNIYICNYKSNENKVPSQLSPQWLCGNPCTSAHAHDVWLHIAGTFEPKSAAQQAKH